ncbi:hypothetical protein ABPG72_008968 [Tetrahymena utriculariae]
MKFISLLGKQVNNQQGNKGLQYFKYSQKKSYLAILAAKGDQISLKNNLASILMRKHPSEKGQKNKLENQLKSLIISLNHLKQPSLNILLKDKLNLKNLAQLARFILAQKDEIIPKKKKVYTIQLVAFVFTILASWIVQGQKSLLSINKKNYHINLKMNYFSLHLAS